MKTRCLRCSRACPSFVSSGPGDGEGPAGFDFVDPVSPEAAVHAAASIAARTRATRVRGGRTGFEGIDRRGYQSTVVRKGMVGRHARVRTRLRGARMTV